MNSRPKTIFCDIDGTLWNHIGGVPEQATCEKHELLPNTKEAIDKWVYQNCKNRYFLGKTFEKNPKNTRPNYSIKIGFEDPKELSYFVLACPHLKYK